MRLRSGFLFVLFPLIFALADLAGAQTCVPPPKGLVSWWAADGNASDTIDANPGTLVGMTCIPPPRGLVSWWPGDGNANDIIGANAGTLLNGATFVPGMVGQA